MKILSAPLNQARKLPARQAPSTYHEPELRKASWLDEYTFIPQAALPGAATGVVFSAVAYNMASECPAAAAVLGAFSGAALSLCTGDSIPSLRVALKRMGAGALLGAAVLASGGIGPAGIVAAGVGMGLLTGIGRAC